MAKSKQLKAKIDVPDEVVETAPSAPPTIPPSIPPPIVAEPPAADEFVATEQQTIELPATAVAELEKGNTVTSAIITPLKLGTYNPATHYTIKKSAFDQLVVNLIANRVKMYARGAMPSRLMEMLDLKDTAEAQKVISEIYLRVANGG